MAHSAFAYAHALMVAGAIVVAVGIEEIVLHPLGHTEWSVAGTVLGGPALYLVGNIIFNTARNSIVPKSRLIALAVIIVLFPISQLVAPVVLGAITFAALLVLAGATGELKPRR